MVVVAAFGTLANTINAGLTAYFRATGCTALTIADVIPLLSKITAYEQEYVIGEMKIWDTGSESNDPNNCAVVKVIIYNDGWICAWFDKESHNQFTGSSFTFIDSQTLAGFGAYLEYPDQWNGCYLKVINSNGIDPDDTECPDDTVFCIRNTDSINGRLQVHADTEHNYHFNTGNTYDVDVYMSNGNLTWWGHTSSTNGLPINLSNRLYRAFYEMWEYLRYSSNSTDSTNRSITKVYLDDGGVFTDKTIDFNDDGPNDVELIPPTEEIDDAFYYGYSNKFSGLNLNIGTAGVGNTIVWEYWGGSSWSSLSVTDLTSGFTVAGSNTVTFTPPEDWAKCFVNSSEQFWIRSRVTVAAFTTQALLTQGWVIVPNALTYTNSNLGMYSFEDTAANYCLMCGISKFFTSNTNVYYYNNILLGHIIYNHSINFGSGTGYSGYLQINGGYTRSYELTNGFICENIENKDNNIGIQNVFKVYNLSGACWISICNILIVS